MAMIRTRPAAYADAEASQFPGLLPDRWREGDDCRSFVATDGAGRLLGHCRGTDNVHHPGSRTYVWHILDDAALAPHSWIDVADSLMTAQKEVSALPLRLKPGQHDHRLLELCRRHHGVLVQLMPPWRYPVNGALRAWTAAHVRTPDGLVSIPPPQTAGAAMLDLYVRHYTAQHARWSPAAQEEILRAENAEDFVPGSAGAFDRHRSRILLRDGQVAAQALVWPPEEAGSAEVTLQAMPYEGPAARADMEACLAGVIEASREDDVLLIDSHVTERMESAMLADLPGPSADDDGWTAIVAIPVEGGPEPVPLPSHLVPAEVRGSFTGIAVSRAPH